MLTGTVRVDVSWAADAENDTTPGTFAASLGTMSLTISDLVSGAGDPLTFGGAPKSNDLETNATATGNAGTEIADIVLGTFSIVAGVGPNDGQLIVGNSVDEAGTATTTPADVDRYDEIAPDTGTVTGSTRLRFVGVGTPDNLTAPGGAGSGAKALFVGQGVDGPLGVIGTYTIDGGADHTPASVTDASATTSIGRLGEDGTQSVDVGQNIYGAFGAQLP